MADKKVPEEAAKLLERFSSALPLDFRTQGFEEWVIVQFDTGDFDYIPVSDWEST